MKDQDLIAAVLAAQAGFVTPSEVISAAARRLVESGSDSLLTMLERSGDLSDEQRKLVEQLAEEALLARNGDARAVASSLGGAKLLETLVSQVDGTTARDAARATAAEVPLERPGQYTRLGELGRGSQSIVRAARDEIVGREVALKELVTPPSSEQDESSRAARARFLREVRLVASLDHPGIVSVHELARREDGTLFCAQKLIRGETLRDRLAKCRSLGERLGLLRHVLDACQAVGFAHSKRIIHRDLKPSNVMVGEHGETVVVDWGLAKHRDEAEEAVPLVAPSAEPLLTVAGAALGTPAYMSPEQARGDLPAIDARSDVFSLGAVLYQVLTGHPPFEGVDREHILENVRAGRFAPVRALAPHAPPELAAIAERALRPDPSDRYRDAEELARELTAYLSGGRVRAYRYGAWELVRKFAASHRALTAGLAVAMGALLVSGVVVAFRLQVVHRDLARSFVERAHAAERESDWALAAAYFAAARTQRDTPEARWGVALAGERAIERILSREGPSGSFTDVGALPDGRMAVLGVAGNRVEVREVEGEKVLWSRNSERLAAAKFFSGGQVQLSLPGGWALFDAASGRPLEMFERQTAGRPCSGPGHPPVTVLNGRLVARGPGGFATLGTNVGMFERCVVSDDGQQVAYQDSSGRVHLLRAAGGPELAERSGTGLRALFFSSHGLVIARQGWLDMLGGPEGDFTIALPETAFGEPSARPGGVAVSPDGHLVVVARIGSNRADVVDLRARVVRGTLHYGQGWPRFAFSLDGQRVFAAGLFGESRLDGWRLPPDDSPTGHPGTWEFSSVDFSPSSRQMVIIDGSKPALDLYGAEGELLASSPVSGTVTGVLFVRDGVVRLSDWRNDQVWLRDVVHRRDLWAHPCRACGLMSHSADGSRLAQAGLDGVEVWDAAANRVLFSETARVGGLLTDVSLSPDGQRVAWTERSSVHVRELESARERTLPLSTSATLVTFGPDSRRLAVITPASLSLWDAGEGRALWNVPHGIPDRPFRLGWSADSGALLVQYEGLGTELLEAGTGTRLAFFPATRVAATVVRPDLRARLVANASNWDLRPVPEPVSDSPAESLARTLSKTGLAMEGVEFVAAP